MKFIYLFLYLVMIVATIGERTLQGTSKGKNLLCFLIKIDLFCEDRTIFNSKSITNASLSISNIQ